MVSFGVPILSYIWWILDSGPQFTMFYKKKPLHHRVKLGEADELRLLSGLGCCFHFRYNSKLKL